jgi:predicted neuraminidase
MKILERRFLPIKTKTVHAASIEFFNDHPVFSWFGGTREGNGDVRIFIYNLNDDGETITIGSEDNVPRWNPVLFAFNNKLLLFEKAGMFCDRWNSYIHDITNWTSDITNKEILNTATILPAGLNGPVKTSPLIVDNNIYCGSSVETACDWSSYIESYKYNNGHFSYSGRSNPLFLKNKQVYQDFNGITRTSLGVIQPTLWLDKNNKMKCLMRSSRNLGKIYYSKKLELNNPYENIWTDPIPTNLPNPNSGIDTIYIGDKLYIVYNPSETNRYPLVVSRVEQVGDTNEFIVKDTLMIKDEVVEKSPFISQELSYPYCCIGENGNINCVYTYGRVCIEHVVISVE